MFAFLTGSRVYGSPTPKSDVDLVVRVDQVTKDAIHRLSDNPSPRDNGWLEGPVRFGKLNLILCVTDEEYAVWKVGTARMLRLQAEDKQTFDKATAKGVLDAYRDEVGILDKADSGGP